MLGERRGWCKPVLRGCIAHAVSQPLEARQASVRYMSASQHCFAGRARRIAIKNACGCASEDGTRRNCPNCPNKVHGARAPSSTDARARSGLQRHNYTTSILPASKLLQNTIIISSSPLPSTASAHTIAIVRMAPAHNQVVGTNKFVSAAAAALTNKQQASAGKRVAECATTRAPHRHPTNKPWTLPQHSTGPAGKKEVRYNMVGGHQTSSCRRTTPSIHCV